MKQVRKQAAITVYLFIIWVVGAQVHNVGGADVVVLMDTSGTILPYYQIINDQVLHSIVTRFVRKGDTFHLLSFSAKPCYEMSQTIITEADLSRVVSRFMLLYQLGSSADFLAGLHFAGAYMKGLPPRPKTMIIISDGIFNPPPDSPYRRYTDERIKTEIAKITADIRSNKWAVYYVKLPFPQNAPVKALDGSFYAGRHIKNGRDRTMRTAEAAASAAAEAAVGVPAFGLPRLDRQDEPPAAQNTLSPFLPPKTSVPMSMPNSSMPMSMPKSSVPKSLMPKSSVQNTYPLSGAADGAAGTTVNTDAALSPAPAASVSRSDAAAEPAAEAAVGVPAFGLPRLDRQDEPPAAQNTLSPFPPPKTSVPMSMPNSSMPMSVPKSLMPKSSVQNTYPLSGAADGAAGTIVSTDAALSPAPAASVSRSDAVAEPAAEAAAGVPVFGLPRLDRQDEPPAAAQNTLSPFLPPKTSVPMSMPKSSVQNTYPLSGAADGAAGTIVSTDAALFPVSPPYTDLSKIFTANLGIVTDSVPESGAISFKEPVITLPIMRLPDTVRSSGTVLKLPLQFENIAAMPLTVHITVLSFSCEAGIAQVLPESQVIMLQPKQYSIHTIAVTLPEIFHDEGLYAADIRVDCLVNGTTLFSHAETVTLTVTAPWFHQMLRKSAALQIPIVQAVGGLVMFTVLLLAGQCIIRYRKKYPALALKQNPLLRSAANQRLVHSPTVPHYTSAVCPIKAPIQLPCLISETLELFVLHQNTAIGKRNIHLLKAGSTMTVGGAKRDDFLIFLVPFPACLAEICYDGTHYNLLIKKPEFFPYEQKPVISDCIGKITTIISDKGYPVSFMFRGYQDPAVRLNALLTSIQKKQ